MSAKREQIIQAALKLFCENGFQYTTTASISKEARVATGTLFVYFPSKEALINTLYKEAKQELNQYLTQALPAPDEADTKARMKHIWVKAHEWALQNKYAFCFIHMYASSPFITQITREEIASLSDFAEKLIFKAIKDGIIVQIDTQLFFLLFDGVWTSTVNYISSTNNTITGKQIIEQAFEIFWKGVSK
jgi:AcrR family transcriptional regulator